VIDLHCHLWPGPDNGAPTLQIWFNGDRDPPPCRPHSVLSRSCQPNHRNLFRRVAHIHFRVFKDFLAQYGGANLSDQGARCHLVHQAE